MVFVSFNVIMRIQKMVVILPSLRAVQTEVSCLDAMVVQTEICCQRFGIAEKGFWQEKWDLCFEMMDFQTSLY